MKKDGEFKKDPAENARQTMIAHIGKRLHPDKVESTIGPLVDDVARGKRSLREALDGLDRIIAAR